MNTLMTLWLITGTQLQMFTEDFACTKAVEALANNGVVMVTLPNGIPIQAVKVACVCVVGEGEAM